MKKTVFLKNGPSHNLPKIKYVISEPHEDLLQWNLSWALTFDFLVHQEGGVRNTQHLEIKLYITNTTHTNKTLTDSTQVAELYSLCGNYTYIYITLK